LITIGVALTDPDAAVTLAVPTACPFTSPFEFTVATELFDELQLTAALMVLPFWSRGLAVSRTLSPTMMVPAGAMSRIEVTTPGDVLSPPHAEIRAESVMEAAKKIVRARI
jgi:hypothetical protein